MESGGLEALPQTSQCVAFKVACEKK
jgi:hypothetical protein